MYYLGFNKSTVENSNFFEKFILFNGDDEFSYKSMYGKEIDYNNMDNFKKISKYFSRCIKKVKKEDKNAKFMLYNQAAIEFMSDTSAIVCLNDIDLIKKLNNKPESRQLLKKEIKILDYKYLKANEISLAKLDKYFCRKDGKYVVQQPVGFNGEGTYLLDKQENLNLNKKTTYSVSEFVEKSIPINNTFMISNKDILIFDGSIQLLKWAKN